jgi:Zn-dependent metalloprotease
MCTDHPRDPRHCIVPPHMLRVLELRGDARQTEMARALLERDRKVREERASRSATPMLRVEVGAGFVAPAFAAAAADGRIEREVYDGERKAALPGRLVRAEGGPPTGDADADAVYDIAGIVHALFFDEFSHNSIDGRGMKIVQTVHHRRNFNNAFWNGSQMVYGDGDGALFRTFVEASVIGHEISHGVVQHSGGLMYQGQSGALNESFADVFGAMTRHYAERTDVFSSDWVIGRGILGPGINGTGLRSMKLPGTAYDDALLGQDPQPYHMDFYVSTTEDNGGVHINSGIPNHAFFLYCMLVGGNSWGTPGRVWYRALEQLNTPFASFADWAVGTLQAAIELTSPGSGEVLALRRAWKLVGIAI